MSEPFDIDRELRRMVAELDPEELFAMMDQLPPEVVTLLLDEFGARGIQVSLPDSPIAAAEEIVEGFKNRPHLNLLSERISAAVADVEAGRSRNIIIEMPPRSGKSLLATQVTPAWLLAGHPSWPVVLSSYSATLATSWGRQVRQWVAEGRLGDHLQISRDSGAAGDWETTEGGALRSRSLGQGLTGFGAKVLVVDDPHKDFADAHSKTSRDSVWNWWTSVAKLRLHPPSLVLVIMCMTGDTPVLRPDGTETPLRDIRPGDEIATYENGGLTTSRVMNWANQGPDDVFSIRLESGRVVRANARHPFLTVDENGVEEWQRTDQLRPGSSILTATGASGEALSAKSPAAPSRSAVRESAGRTTTSVAGQKAIDLPQLTPIPGELRGSSTATASPRRNTMLWSPDSGDSAQSAESPRQTGLPTGAASSASTTITRPAESENFSATTATSLSSGTSHLRDSEQPLSTWSVTPDRVVSIEPAGREDVYDLQVERTENFIANGLVSHNTRWHEDDLVGRLLSTDYPGDPADWEVIRLPAIAEADDVLGREVGQPLYSPLIEETEEQALERWAEVRESVGTYVWSALYQQRPSPARGAIFNTDWWRFWSTDPAHLALDETGEDTGKVKIIDPGSLPGATWLDSWDFTFKGSDSSDFVVGQRWVRSGAHRFLIAQQRGRWGFVKALEQMTVWAGSDPLQSPYGSLVHKRVVEEKANGAAIIESLKEKVSGIKPVSPKDSKEARARAVTPEIESGNVFLPHPSMPGFEWVRDLISELRNFPNDANDDQVDAMSQALLELRGPAVSGISVPGGPAQAAPRSLVAAYSTSRAGRLPTRR